MWLRPPAAHQSVTCSLLGVVAHGTCGRAITCAMSEPAARSAMGNELDHLQTPRPCNLWG